VTSRHTYSASDDIGQVFENLVTACRIDESAITRPKPTALPSNDRGEIRIGPGKLVSQAGWRLHDGKAVGLGGDIDAQESIRQTLATRPAQA